MDPRESNETSLNMKTISEETISVLNHLIEICGEGADGFAEAAKEVEQPELQQLFQRLSKQRLDFGVELSLCVRELGEEPDDSGSLAGKMHRGWIKLREALTSRDTHAVLAECERGEDRAVSAYRKAVHTFIDPTAADVVSRQFLKVQRSHDEVRDLRDSPAYRKV